MSQRQAPGHSIAGEDMAGAFTSGAGVQWH